MSEQAKKLAFWTFTLLFPFLVFALVETAFVLSGYNAEKNDLFIEYPAQKEFLIVNPNFVTRYFPSFIPQIAPQPFRNEKTDSTFRVFVFGGSSTQGFPYNYYYSFATQLEQKLILNTQGMNVEVINLGMTAVNSYVIRDLAMRVEEYEPDAVIIYAGHNEYYGSFGVGSTQFNVGNSITTKRLILWMKNFVFYQFIEDLFNPIDEDSGAQRTMMARVVSESNIEQGSEIYKAGITQFEENIGDVITGFQNENVPVFIGTVSSNLKDQIPFSDSIETNEVYNRAKRLLEEERKAEAFDAFKKAKELDEIRFRAPAEVNEIIKRFTERDGVYLADVDRVLNEMSVSGIADNSLFIDHLHPTEVGHNIMADIFLSELVDAGYLNNYYQENSFDVPLTISRFEDSFSTTPILRLTSGYPFVKRLSIDQEILAFERGYQRIINKSFADSLGAETWRNGQIVAFSLKEVVNYAKSRNDTLAVAKHYYELFHWLSFNRELLTQGVDFLLNNREMDTHIVNMISKGLNNGMEDPYLMNMLAATYIINDELDRAGYLLSKSEKLDSNSINLLYNYARYHVLKGDTVQARNYYQRFIEQQSDN